MKSKMIIVAAPSGAGKSSFVDRIIKEIPLLVDVITYTTRKPRAGEMEGHPYHFISKEMFSELLAKDFFVEWANVHDNLYGTPIDQIKAAWEQKKCVIMDIDVQGAATLRSKFPDSTHIFILPPSIDELRRRVIKRSGGQIPFDLDLRMKNAEVELQEAGVFGYQVINDDFEQSFAYFKKIVEDLLS